VVRVQGAEKRCLQLTHLNGGRMQGVQDAHPGLVTDLVGKPRTTRTACKDQTSFRAYLKQLGLDKDLAMKVQRIGAMPEEELERAFARWHQAPIAARC
jgi:hypothetical protein